MESSREIPFRWQHCDENFVLKGVIRWNPTCGRADTRHVATLLLDLVTRVAKRPKSEELLNAENTTEVT